MEKMTHDHLYPNPDQYGALPERFRPLSVLGKHIPTRSLTALEGTPLYVGQPWDETHHFAYNEVMPHIKDILGRLFSHHSHLALIDDFTTADHNQDRSFLDWMIHKPSQVYFESEFANEAFSWINRFQQSGNVFPNKGTLWLNSGRMTPLTTKSDRPSCELLDALFQTRKQPAETNIIIHPSYFAGQQIGMRDVLLAMKNPLPFNLINIFFRAGTITQIIKTDKYGRTKKLY